MKKLFLAFLASAMILTGCATNSTHAERGAGIGAAGGAVAGAILGQALGHDPGGAMVGAIAGAAIGSMTGASVGSAMDQEETEMRNALAASEAAAVKREGELLSIVLKGDLTFDSNSDVILPGLYSELDRIAQVMVKYPQTSILVAGYTDSTGSFQYNQALSMRRASNVKNILVQRGVQQYRISTVGYGENQPLASNDTPEGRQKNRRVEIRIDTHEQPVG